MAIESGRITHIREAVLPVRLAENLTVDCIVDTGFSGALMLPRDIVSGLSIPLLGRETFELVSGQFFTANLALAQIDWLGQKRPLRIVISEGSDALIGTEMLDGNRLVIDYINNRVTLTNDLT